MQEYLWSEIHSCWGTLHAVVNNNCLCRIGLPGESKTVFLEFLQHRLPSDEISHAPHPLFFELEKQLSRYLSRKLKHFDLPLVLMGTAFQKTVWQELIKIPYGATISYIELANRLGKPGAVRAVGSANGANPLPIVVPCHRVIGADGKLVGYGGGLEMKRKLLQLESVQSSLDFT